MVYQQRSLNSLLIAIIIALSLYLIVNALIDFAGISSVAEIVLGLVLLVACYLLYKMARQDKLGEGTNASAQTQTQRVLSQEHEATEDVELYRALINSYPAALAILFDRDFYCKLISGSLLGKSGFPTPEMEGNLLWETLSPELLHTIETPARNSLLGEAAALDITLEDKNYRTDFLPIRNVQGKVIAGLVVLRDVSERRREERRLREIEDVYRRAITAADCVLYLKDERDWTYSFMGEGIYALTGYTAQEMTPDLWSSISKFDIFRGELSGLSWEEAVEKVRSGEVDAWTEDSMIITRQGEERWIADTSVEIRDEASRSIGSIGLLQDITERKQTEASLRSAKDAAETAARTKAEFLANMSHEIRTPLNAIIGMTSLLLDTPLVAEQRDFTETIRTSGNTLLTLINDVLDFSKIEFDKLELEMAPFDLNVCIEEILDLFAVHAYQKGLELTYSISPDTPTVIVGDSSRLRQILTNLVGNAVKFTEQGEVAVWVESEADAGHLLLHFAVQDTGIGIREDDRANLFESFSQVDASITRRYGGLDWGWRSAAASAN